MPTKQVSEHVKYPLDRLVETEPELWIERVKWLKEQLTDILEDKALAIQFLIWYTTPYRRNALRPKLLRNTDGKKPKALVIKTVEDPGFKEFQEEFVKEHHSITLDESVKEKLHSKPSGG